MSRRLLLLLALSLGLQTAVANPGVAMAEVRAMACCAHHCDEPLSLPSARDCCGLMVKASGPAEAPRAASLPAPSAMLLATPAPVAIGLASAQARADVLRLPGAGPPAFLVHRHLLI